LKLIFSFQFHADAEHRFPWSVLACSRQPSALAARLCMAALHRGGPRAPRRRVVMMRAAAPRRTPVARRRPVTSRPRPTPHPLVLAAAVHQQASERHVAISHVIPKITMKLPNFHARDPEKIQ